MNFRPNSLIDFDWYVELYFRAFFLNFFQYKKRFNQSRRIWCSNKALTK